MRPSLGLRSLVVLSMALPAVGLAQANLPTSNAASAPLTKAQAIQLAQNANQRVIVLFRNQHRDLNGRANRAARVAAIASDQASVLSELSQVRAQKVLPYHIINAVAATVSSAEVQHLQANPNVLAVVPDRQIKKPTFRPIEAASGTATQTTGATGKATPSPAACSSTTPTLEPEALQVTNTAFSNPSTPQAQNLVTGKGVRVAILADGLDPNNPEFIRNGQSVVVDYQDFSGDGINAPTAGGEAFGDASSVAAQGNNVYDVNNYRNPAHQDAGSCLIKIRGMAPGADLLVLKVFGQATGANSGFVQAIQYADDHGADVINESFGSNPFPDTATDPISLADAQAVADGSTITISTGDAGTAGTLGSPSTDPGIIATGATTTWRLASQTFYRGIQLGSGNWISNNIAAFSSAGISQNGQRTVDVAAPGDSGWAACTPNTDMYSDCTTLDLTTPASIESFGGTSESAPLTAGEAALVIEAYRNTHGGASPSPQLVKQLIMSTAQDLGIPSYEQGAGLINSLAAVQAAMSIATQDGTGKVTGDTLVANPNAFSAAGAPGQKESFSFQVTNTGSTPQYVAPYVRKLGPATSIGNFTLQIKPTDPSTPTFVDWNGRVRAYTVQTFNVPSGAQRLDASIAWSPNPPALVFLTLLDPQGNFVQTSEPQDTPGFPFSGFGHVDVRFPTAGQWKALVFTNATPAGFAGPIHLTISSANFVSAGTVSPQIVLLGSGQSQQFTATMSIPAAAGDVNAEIGFLTAGTSTGHTAHLGAIPLIIRTVVPVGPFGGTFSGVLTGGNGRAGAPGQTLVYDFNVPFNQKDLELNLSLADPAYNLAGFLVDPNGMPVEVHSNQSLTDPFSFTNTMQFFRMNPQAGMWRFIVIVNDSGSGNQTSISFNGTIRFNQVKITSSGIPNNPRPVLTAGRPLTATITVTNTGNATKAFFVDARTPGTASYPTGGTGTWPGDNSQSFVVPPFTTQTLVSLLSEAPIEFDTYNIAGPPPFGGTGSPDILGQPYIDPNSGAYAATASITEPEVPMGPWGISPSGVGPYPPDGASPQAYSWAAVLFTQPFDLAVSSSTGNAWTDQLGLTSNTYNPVVLGPGQSSTITVVITPSTSATTGTVVKGNLYVETFDGSAGAGFTGSGDELGAVPYSYTVG